jgi:hypothetical protein
MVLNRNLRGEADLRKGVEEDDRRSEKDGVEGGVMNHERHSADGILADGESRSDDKGERGVEAYASTAFIASPKGRFMMPVERVTVPLFVHCPLCWAPSQRSVAA